MGRVPRINMYRRRSQLPGRPLAGDAFYPARVLVYSRAADRINQNLGILVPAAGWLYAKGLASRII